MGEAGVIVNITDVAVLEAWPLFAPHAAAKAALAQLTRSLARAFAPEVRVCAVAPGPVLLPDGSDDAMRERHAARTALGRLGSPEDVVGAVAFLIEADYVTGEQLVVDGGHALCDVPRRVNRARPRPQTGGAAGTYDCACPPPSAADPLPCRVRIGRVRPPWS